MILVQIVIFWPPYKQLGRPTEATLGTLFWPLYILNSGFLSKITVLNLVLGEYPRSTNTSDLARLNKNVVGFTRFPYLLSIRIGNTDFLIEYP